MRTTGPSSIPLKMGIPSKERCNPGPPLSGPPPVFSLAVSNTRQYSKDNISPATEVARLPWFHRHNPQPASQAQAQEPPPRLDDVGLEAQVVEGSKQNIICGCSKANFIMIVFVMIVLLAAAVGGGVSGSLFAAKR